MGDAPQQRAPTAAERVTLVLVGLSHDGGSTRAVEQALSDLLGVRHVYVCAGTEMAYVVYDGDLVRPDQFVAAVERVGLHAGTPERR